MQVSKTIEFDAAHRLPSHCGRCSNIHGHRWKLCATLESYTLQSSGSSDGMAIDFKDVKRILMDNIDEIFDHSLTLYCGDPYCKQMYEMFGYKDFPKVSSSNELTLINFPEHRFNIVNFIPTSENLIRWMFNSLYKEFKKLGVSLVQLELYETPSSKASFTIREATQMKGFIE